MKTKMMKRIAVIAVIALCSLHVMAYEPLYTDGKKWVTTVRTQPAGYKMYQHYAEVVGDTVIGKYTVKKIDCRQLPHENSVLSLRAMTGFGSIYPTQYYIYRMEEGGKIYDVTSDGTASLIMDFSSPVGTSWTYKLSEGWEKELTRIYTIVSCDTLQQDHFSYRRLTVEVKTTPHAHITSMADSGEQMETDYYVWIEGVGELSSYGLLGSDYGDTTDRSDLCYCLFPTMNMRYFNASGVNPVIPPASIDVVESDLQPLSDDRVYDLSGRVVIQPQKGQIYVRAGKKILW